jgi:hypothetical protein
MTANGDVSSATTTFHALACEVSTTIVTSPLSETVLETTQGSREAPEMDVASGHSPASAPLRKISSVDAL